MYADIMVSVISVEDTNDSLQVSILQKWALKILDKLNLL